MIVNNLPAPNQPIPTVVTTGNVPFHNSLPILILFFFLEGGGVLLEVIKETPPQPSSLAYVIGIFVKQQFPKAAKKVSISFGRHISLNVIL